MEEKKFLWYMISTVSGKEDLVVESLRNRIISEQVDDCFNNEATEDGAFKIFKKPSLTAKEAEKKLNGEPYTVKMINMYSGYIFINMYMSDKAWFVIRNTQYVTGLIGSSGKGAKPTPVTSREIRKCFKSEEKMLKDFYEGKLETKFSVGEIVEIIDGPFKGQSGKVIEASDSKKMVSVEVEYFGRNVPTDFDYDVIKSQEK
ncbi:transcription termination/antitermination protein NusG [Mycoplasma sp. ES3157-GEN-MYC]|uniref:Transcription termination/antitermination protein NusG n=1 Tax=Mycoplasma miroungigenitalium TaxID=754515 RepID=A0A6M4JBR3_9MOLU|nr:transcription termination/antitermination protein NusG [Mycoplasma miroungigenitalium]MBU4690434.1 transcription termination/antitermination protein NusG [Mycoplasma miroungigenitalium]MBU4691701.1 transcription termination/antitermination protein NusG [Mycoplasma miroungigenitalium]QJR43529.1 transcription termination/antitermination protein NusG [Mycoplasma miroungigenitalium]